jgi:hypothetical protein
MKELVWKELRENRMIIAFAAMLTFVFFLVPALAVITHQSTPIDLQVFVMVTLVVWVASALLCGSSIVAQEIGSGSLQMLSSMPISRKDIWWTKIGAGMLIMVGCIVASTLTMTSLCSVGTLLEIVAPGMSTIDWIPGNDNTFGVLAATIPAFAVGAVVTMLADRTISAFMAASVVGVLLYLGILSVVTELLYLFNGYSTVTFDQGYQLDTLIGMVVFVTVALLTMSYKLFTCGETLKTAKRYKILAGYLLPPGFICCSLLITWLIVRD